MKKLKGQSLDNVAGGAEAPGGKLSFTIADGATVKADSFIAIDNFKEREEFLNKERYNKLVDRKKVVVSVF